jgi:hypothetical protein
MTPDLDRGAASATLRRHVTDMRPTLDQINFEGVSKDKI